MEQESHHQEQEHLTISLRVADFRINPPIHDMLPFRSQGFLSGVAQASSHQSGSWYSNHQGDHQRDPPGLGERRAIALNGEDLEEVIFIPATLQAFGLDATLGGFLLAQ